MIKAYHTQRGDTGRTTMLVHDSAHGTNPATAHVVGYKVEEVKSDARGLVDLEDLKSKLGPHVAGLMLTNPNTLGLFEEDILEMSQLVHNSGGLLYYDGANLNALLGKVRPGDMGFDVMHINLHKTFSTPHGGGGPGSGPVGVTEELVKYLPNPRIKKIDDYYFLENSGEALGQISSYFGNYMVSLRAYTYIRTLGKENLRLVGPYATLNANYISMDLKPVIT